MNVRPIALTLAGLDPSGGAGLIADIQAFAAAGARPTGIVTMHTVQGATAARTASFRPHEDIAAELDALLVADAPAAVKLGAIGLARNYDFMAMLHARGVKVVVDPVFIASTGDVGLAEEGAPDALLASLRHVDLLCPNAPEAGRLAGMRVHTRRDARAAAQALLVAGASAVLIKGGHLEDDAGDLYADGESIVTIPAPPRIFGRVHGTGCVLSAAITARLAHGEPLAQAVRGGRAALDRGLERAEAVGDVYVLGSCAAEAAS